MNTQGMIPAKENANKKISDRYQKKTYAKGATCIYGDTLYRAKADITTAEEWNAAHWEETNMETIRAGMAADLSSLNANKTETYRKLYEVNSIANTHVEINGADGVQYAIPVIVRESNTLEHQTTVFKDSNGKWYIVSDVAQTYTIAFYELTNVNLT